MICERGEKRAHEKFSCLFKKAAIVDIENFPFSCKECAAKKRLSKRKATVNPESS